MLKAWDITLDSDEGYWILVVKTEDCDRDDCVLKFQLPADVAEQLHKWVKLEIDPWIQEKEEARAAYKRDDPRWKPKLVQQAEAQELLDDGVYDGDEAKRAWAEGVARGDTGL